MSLALSKFPFLQHGKPFFGAEDFKKKQSALRHYRRWEAVVFVGRWWCVSIRQDRIRPPAALLIFGVEEGKEKKKDQQQHFLLFATVLDDAKPLTVSEELNLALEACPPFYRPAEVAVSYYSQVQHTLDTVRGIRGSAVAAQIAAIAEKEKFTSTNHLLRNREEEEESDEGVVDTTPFSPPQLISFSVVVRQPEGADECERKAFSLPAVITAADPLAAASSASSGSAAASQLPIVESYTPDALMESVAEWMVSERNMFPDASMMSLFAAVGRRPSAEASDAVATDGEKEEKVEGKASTTALTAEECAEGLAAANEVLALGATFPQLSTMRAIPAPPTADKNGKIPKEEESGRGADNALVCGVFTVPTSYLGGNKYPHVLFLQRPSHAKERERAKAAGGPMAGANGGAFANSETAAAAASEGIEIGPTQPQPIGIELHLHTDPGDAAYVCGVLSRPLNVQLYEDLLHPDGEVYVQFGPVEGAAVTDAEAAVRAFHFHNHQSQKADDDAAKNSPLRWGFTSTIPTTTIQQDAGSNASILRPVGDGSNFSVPVPRVVFNAPTGKTERRTPLEAPKTTLLSTSPDAAMLKAAAAAIRYFTSEVMVVDADKQQQQQQQPEKKKLPADCYAIDWSKAQLDLSPRGDEAVPASDAGGAAASAPAPTLHTCNFCRRQRLKMMRCGGCKVASYCCKDHQVKDWKGQHKGECKLLKVADDEFKASIAPAVAAKAARVVNASVSASAGAEKGSSAMPLEAGGRGFDAADASNALTLLKLLRVCRLGAYGTSNSAEEARGGVDEAFFAALQQRRSARLAAASKEKGLVAGGVDAEGHGGQKVIVVHVLNLGDVRGFMAALAGWWAQQKQLEESSGYQYRIILANSPSIATGDNNKVFSLANKSALSEEAGDFTFAEVPATGVLGDIWRVATSSSSSSEAADDGSNAASKSPFLVRLCSERYHNCAEKLFNSALLSPHCVLSVGPSTTEGQSFFNASTEVIADDVLGFVPFAAAEPHYLAASRTVSALGNRTKLSPVNKAPALDDSNGLVNAAIVNVEGICQVPVGTAGGGGPSSSAAEGGEPAEGATGVASSAVPLHLNAYITAMLPKF